MSSVTSISGVRAKAVRKADQRIANHRTVMFLISVVALLSVIGLGATMSASWVVALNSEGASPFLYFYRQAAWLVTGAVVMIVASKTPYQWYEKFAAPIFAISLVGLVAVLLVGTKVSGATRWIDLGFTRFQPSEFAKFGLVVFLSAVLTRKDRLLGDFAHYAAPVFTSIGVVTLLIIKQPDLGTTLVVVAGALAVVAVSSAPIRFVVASMVLGLLGAGVLAVSQTYRLARVLSFFSDNSDVLNEGYQLDQSLKALGSGGMFGVGLGESRARWLFLPNAHTDFIFAIIGEELGFLGASFILLGFALISVLGVVVALRAPDRFGRLLATGITAWIVAQAVVNIGGVIGALPISGIALPFVSYGGTALIMAMGSVGVLINIAGQGRSGGMHRTR